MSVLTEAPTVIPPQEDGADLCLLGDELQTIKEQLMGAVPEEVQELLLNHLNTWKSTDLLQDSLKEGDVAPDFLLPDQDGNMISSVDLRAKGPIVVIFFRGNWCNFCNATLRMIRKYSAHFKARGATVVAISPQTIEQSKVTQKNAGLNFSVLSDQGSEYSQLLNIAYVVEDDMRALLENVAGNNFVEINGSNSYDAAVLPIPATYVIETDGRVTYSFLDTDFTQRAEPIDVLNALPRLGNRRLTLNERIDMEMGKLRDTQPEHQMKVLFDAVDQFKVQGIERQALTVGQKAPDFSLVGSDGKRVESKKLRRSGPLVVTFHYGHRSPLCKIQLEEMQRHLSNFEAKGANVVAISSALSNTNANTNATFVSSSTKFPMLEDTPDQSVAKQFGLLYTLPNGHLFGVQDPDGAKELPIAATYVLDGRTGTILYSFVTADPTQRAEPLDILQAIPTEFQRRDAVKRGPFSLLLGGRMAARAFKRARRGE